MADGSDSEAEGEEYSEKSGGIVVGYAFPQLACGLSIHVFAIYVHNSHKTNWPCCRVVLRKKRTTEPRKKTHACACFCNSDNAG